MISIYVLSALSIAFGTLSGFFNLKKKPVLRLFFKGLGSLLFIAVALVAIYRSGATLNAILVLSALILGTVGDLYLCLNKDLVVKGKSAPLFLIGGASFFGGHVLFSTVYLIRVPFNPLLIPTIFIIPVLLIIVAFFAKKSLKLGALLPFAVAYGVILNLMLAVTINAFVQNSTNTFGALSLGAGILFAISDIALLFKEFSKLKDNKILIYVVLVTYYVAQCLFATSICF